jgi:hypothetical protein
VAYSLLFLLLALWSQMALFAGCAAKNEEKLYHFSSPWFCLDRVDEVTARLSVVGWPVFGIVSIACGFVCLLIGLFFIVGQKEDVERGLAQLHSA